MNSNKIIYNYKYITIIIVNYNSEDYLIKCLDSIKNQTFDNYNIIVVDNSEKNNISKLKNIYKNVLFIYPGKNLGFAGGNNLALNYKTDSEWVLLINPDASLKENCIEKLIESTKKNREYDFFGCLMRSSKMDEKVDGTGDLYHVSGYSWRRNHGMEISKSITTAGEIFGPCGAAAMYRRSSLEKVNGFDEDYFCYHEDVDLAFRLRLQGYKCWYEPEAEVYHIGSAITGKNSKFSIYYGHRNMLWTFIKNMPTKLLIMHMPLHILLTLILIVINLHNKKSLIIIKAKIDALLEIRKLLKKRSIIQNSKIISDEILIEQMSKGFNPLFLKLIKR